jgi:hypothetical protein
LRPGAASRESDVALPPLLRDSVVPWVEWVPLRDDLAALAATDRGMGARLLERRFGWDGAAPLSGQDAAQGQGMDVRQAGKMAAEAFRRLRAAAAGR